MKEDRRNKQEETDILMYSMLMTHKRLNMYFFYNTQYMTYLNDIIKKERLILNEMIIRKSNLEVFLQDINKKVIKIKSKLELYKDMKKFLLLVKFKVTLVDKKEEKKAISEKKQQEDVYNKDKELFLTY